MRPRKIAFGSPSKSKDAPASWVLRSKYCIRRTLAQAE
jgi:hypothetical protein